jgi:4-hydroxybenzoate polyprenyltransferase
VKGLPFTKKVLILLVAITFVLLVIAQIYLVQFLKVLAAIWLFLAVEVPLVYFLLKLQKAQSKTDFHSLSSMLKLIMAGGIASIIAGQF